MKTQKKNVWNSLKKFNYVVNEKFNVSADFITCCSLSIVLILSLIKFLIEVQKFKTDLLDYQVLKIKIDFF